MLLQIEPLLRLGSKCYYRYYTWVQMLLHLGPLLDLGAVITPVPSTGNTIGCRQIRN